MEAKPETIVCDKAPLEDTEKEGQEMIKEFLLKLNSLWGDFGIDDTRKAKRTSVVWGHVRNLLQEIYDEESEVFQTLQMRVIDFTRQVYELQKALGIKATEICGSLVQREEMLRFELDKLKEIRHSRIQQFQHLKSAECRYSKVMGLKIANSSCNKIPLENELEELKNKVAALKSEKDRRHKQFHLVKRDLTTILEETELEVETSFEKAILSGKEESFLSDDTFRALEEAIYKAEQKKIELHTMKENLMEKLLKLWDKLNFTVLYKDEFISAHTDCNLSVVKAIEKELAKCETIWQEHLRKDLDSVRHELQQLWSKCFASKGEMNLLDSHSITEIDEDVIKTYKSEAEKWRVYYESAKPILEKIAEREKLWNDLITFESKATDPSRFKNKKWNMLHEEKERKRLQNALPGLEKDILAAIRSRESESKTPFLFNGTNYEDYINQQWSSRCNEKENKKIERRLSSQLKIRTVFETPTKRSVLTAPNTPKSTSKISSFHTPLSCFKTTPATVGKCPKVNSAQKETPKSSRKITSNKREKLFTPCENCGLVLGRGLFSKERHQCPASVKDSASPNCTSYSDFVKPLSSANRNDLQSSVLLKQELKSKKKFWKGISDAGKSPQADPFKSTPKLTPNRGKLGLPFLF